MACKKGVHKVKDSNIEKFVSSATFVNTVASQLKQQFDLDIKQTFNKPSYQQEISKIIQLWNTELGRTWKQVKISKVRQKMLQLPNGEEPWLKINNAIENFNEWFEKHLNIFKIDHTFQR